MHVELIIPLQLMEDTLDIYQQLSNHEKADVGLTKAALYKAFVMDPCTVYECFTTQTLIAGETVDVFFVALKKLAVLFGGLPEQALVYVFMAGLLARVKPLLRVSTSIKAMQLVERARAIIRDKAKLGLQWPRKQP